MLDQRIRRAMQGIYYRIMSPIWMNQFTPHVELVDVGDYSFRFFFGTPQANDWYWPLKPYALLEYLWVSGNISIAGERIIDAGAHHGHYSLFFSSFSPKLESVIAVDPLPSNCALIEVNSTLNGFAVQILEAAISNHGGHDTFVPRSNGRLFQGVGIKVRTLPLFEVDPSATVVKLDIEGAEFIIIPSQIDLMENVHTWIIEVHPRYGDPRDLVDQFRDRGFTISYLDKLERIVRPYHSNDSFDQSTTIFCIKDLNTS